MNDENYSSAVSSVSFPPVPVEISEKYKVENLSFRVFGIEESDLEFDFSQKNVPALITGILSHCTIGFEENRATEFFRDLTVGKRLELLIYLAAGENRTAFSFPFKCVSCGLEMELEITLEEISEQQKEADLVQTVGFEADGKVLKFRKPVGRDQEDWQSLIFENAENLRQKMAETLKIEPEQPEIFSTENLEKIEQILDEADSLIDFSCRVRCSECETVGDFPIDLTNFALAELARAQQFLILTVHRLASRYHWSEKEIFAIPHWRRMRYVNLIADKK